MTITRNITLTKEQKQKHEEIRKQVEASIPRLKQEASMYKEELDARIHAFKLLKTERESRHLSLSEIANRSGIDKGRLSKLENDAYPNPTLETLMRIADAIGVQITIGITKKAA